MLDRRPGVESGQSTRSKVSIRRIRKNFGAYRALDDVELEIQAGEFLTLLGPSGCGKTTLMRIIAGLESSDAGSVFIDGRDVTQELPRRRGLGMVFQSYSLFPHMTVAENVGYGLRVKGCSRDEIQSRVSEMLRLIRLPDIADRRPASLSGGQQQRVALARALATQPSLLMLDEPLGALDLKLRHQLQLELRRIHRETGMTFLFVTHDQEEALFLSDRIAVMRDGRIEQLATPEIIYGSPRSDYVADFIGDVTLLDCRWDPDDRSVARIPDCPDAGPIRLASPVNRSAFRLVVRPEEIDLQPPEVSGLPSEVLEVINEGSTTLVLLKASNGVQLKSRMLGRPSAMIRRGVRVSAVVRARGVCFDAVSP